MTFGFRDLYRDAWALWQRDRAAILPLAGLFQFVPQWGLLMLVPSAPSAPETVDAAAMEAFTAAFTAWIGAHGLWFVAGFALALFGTLAIVAIEVDRRAATVGQAMLHAGGLVLRYFLASLLVVLPASLLVGPALALPAGSLLLGMVVVWLLARTMLIASIIVAERPVGAVKAITLSWRRTKGRGLMLASVLAVAIVGGQAVAGAVMRIAEPIAASPVAMAAISGIAALAMTAASLASALLGVAAYRRLPVLV
ncbi:hypothetical protein [Sphingomonas japonica]|uniref:Glycerophosphoryl diester phosphodiesterase membrane domain-containing protein n=1 Tax=Sphingomonas japonica TaxID=511662 RepID=A0ABX0TXC8_9SPHN|nr:hypothetical protein [Sphingomonas japonica]NIJ22950.1 hypothetical protein [Sphingomonas japonica]